MATAAFFSRNAAAQLAITEMMSAHNSPADFFELTNFGTNTINLAGYEYTDADHAIGRYPLPYDASAPLGPGQSIIYVRTNLTILTVAEFRDFWGSCLSSDVQVLPIDDPGFSSFGDSLTIFDGANVVDSVEFGRARRPVSFVYDPLTGAFGTTNTLESGGCLSVVDNNIASPRKTIGPVPLAIRNPPSSQSQCVGLNATLTVDAIGMPHPRFQWFFEQHPIPGGVDQSLIVSNMSVQTEGSYSVLVSNGLSNIMSAPATLSLNTTPSSPTIVSPPADRTVIAGRTARFEISVCAYPPATYQWSYNGVPLPDETNRILFIRNCTLDLSGRSYDVVAQNEFGSVSASGTLYVTNSSPLRITELQANPNPGGDGHNDWFEITNFGQSAAQLEGYRFSDQFRLIDANIVKRSVILRPLESVIFVKNSSVGSFFEWWGPDQLPANLQVLPFSGFSLNARKGDALYVWDETALDPWEYLDSVSFITNSSGTSINFEFNPFGDESVEGEGGAIKAIQSDDIGTPGFTASWRPSDVRPQFYSIKPAGIETVLAWRAGILGGTFRIEFTDNLTSDKWSTLLDTYVVNVARGEAVIRDPGMTNNRLRFYRIVDITR